LLDRLAALVKRIKGGITRAIADAVRGEKGKEKPN